MNWTPIRIFLVFFSLFSTVFCYADFPCKDLRNNNQASKPVEFQNFRSILSCIHEYSPRILKANALAEEAKAFPLVAQQWINPTFGAQALYASPSNPNGTELQGYLLFPLDLGGVQTSRTKKAVLQTQEQSLLSRLEREEVLRTDYLALHRIRQLNVQLEILEQTNRSLENSIKTYLSRPKLSPENETTLETLKLTQQEVQSQLEIYSQEQHSLVHDIEIELGFTWNATPTSLPQVPLHWPKLSEENNIQNSPNIKILHLAHERETHELQIVRAEKFPIVSVGPFLSWSKVPTQSGFQMGIVLQAPIPVIESFSGSQELAKRAGARAKVASEAGMRENEGELNHYSEIYLGSVRALTQLKPSKVTQASVKKTENFFRQGLIPGISYVEILRQDLTLRQTRDELEKRAIDAWCKIQGLQDRFKECFL